MSKWCFFRSEQVVFNKLLKGKSQMAWCIMSLVSHVCNSNDHRNITAAVGIGCGNLEAPWVACDCLCSQLSGYTFGYWYSRLFKIMKKIAEPDCFGSGDCRILDWLLGIAEGNGKDATLACGFCCFWLPWWIFFRIYFQHLFGRIKRSSIP